MLRTENLHYSIGKKMILNGISAQFHPGDFNMILGPNGSGKSTFLKIFSGEINKYNGKVFYADENVAQIKKEELNHEYNQPTTHRYLLYYEPVLYSLQYAK